MTGHSNNFFQESNPVLIEKFEDMLKLKTQFFFDVDEIELLADHFLEHGDHTRANLAIQHGLELHPGSSGIKLKEAYVLLQLNEPKAALKILNVLEASEPTNTELLLFKAVVHRNLSDHEGTKACLMKALKATPDNKEEIYLDLAFEQELVEDYKGAISSLKQSLEINPDHDASLFELGYCYDMAQDLESGADFFISYLDRYPYNFVAWYNLALCYEKLGLFEKAIETVGFAIAIKPDFTNAYILKGNMYTACDMDALAIEAYSESFAYDADNPLVHTAIGECFERMSDHVSAEYHYKHALTIDEHYVDALMGLGALKEFEERNTEALAYYRDAIQFDKTNMDNWHIYAELLVKLENFEEAEKAYMHMTIAFPDDPEAWIGLGKVKDELYGPSEALLAIDEGLKVLVTERDLELNRIMYLIKDGRMMEGTNLLAQSLSSDPSGGKYFESIFPNALQIANIAGLIDLFTQENPNENEF